MNARNKRNYSRIRALVSRVIKVIYSLVQYDYIKISKSWMRNFRGCLNGRYFLLYLGRTQINTILKYLYSRHYLKSFVLLEKESPKSP
jgi:ABC-type enterochelin transport system permease subunit